MECYLCCLLYTAGPKGVAELSAGDAGLFVSPAALLAEREPVGTGARPRVVADQLGSLPCLHQDMIVARLPWNQHLKCGLRVI